MPPGTDCPYSIRIFAVFEMIRPYHVVIRIWGKLLKNKLLSMCSETTVLSSTQLAFSAKFPENGRFRLPRTLLTNISDSRTTWRNTPISTRPIFVSVAPSICRFVLDACTQFRNFCKLHCDTNRVKNVAIHQCIDEWYGLIQIFTEKIRIPPKKLWRVCTLLVPCNGSFVLLSTWALSSKSSICFLLDL